MATSRAMTDISPRLATAPKAIRPPESVAGRAVSLAIPPEFDLHACLESGQAFRWYPEGGGYVGIVRGHALRLWDSCANREPGTRVVRRKLWAVHIGSAPGSGRGELSPEDLKGLLWDYFSLGTDYGAIAGRLGGSDPVMRAAISVAPGLRILRQEPWETLVSFVLSANNNIPRIKRMVETLAARFGPRVAGRDVRPGGHEPLREAPALCLHGFPEPAHLARAGLSELQGCGLGFRARYILEISRSVSGGEIDLDSIAGLETPAAKDRLMSLPGVGPKIADCVLLFSYGRTEAFPVDVWIKRAMEELYLGNTPTPSKRIVEYAARRFGVHAGHAQAYLYVYIRESFRRPFPPRPGDKVHS